VLGVGARILDAPTDYPRYGNGYYAVFFTDPDGVKLEFVHWP
jgi:glyoxylase I family protein